MSTKVAVIIPVFNGERYLREAIASVFAQRYEPLEVTVVNDGSTDGSASLVHDHWPSVTVLQQGRSGAAVARNAGVTHTTAEVLAFLDADDVWLPDKLTHRLEALQSGGGSDCVFSSVRQFLSPGLDPADFPALVTGRPMAGYVPGAMLVRRAAFLAAGGFATDVPVGELIPWLARARAIGLNIRLDPEEVLLRRVHGSNMTSGADPDHRGYLQALRAARDIARTARATGQ